MQAIKYLEVFLKKRKKPPKAYFDHLELNKTAFKLPFPKKKNLLLKELLKQEMMQKL